MLIGCGERFMLPDLELLGGVVDEEAETMELFADVVMVVIAV